MNEKDSKKKAPASEIAQSADAEKSAVQSATAQSTAAQSAVAGNSAAQSAVAQGISVQKNDAEVSAMQSIATGSTVMRGPAPKKTVPKSSAAKSTVMRSTVSKNVSSKSAASESTAMRSAANLLSHGLEARSILLDSRLQAIGIGEEARLALGSISKAADIGEFLSAPDAFRFEEFARKASGYAGLSALELTLSGVPGFSYACACRREIFGSEAILITLYKSKRDFLLAYESMAAYNFLPLSEENILPRLETARKMIALFAQSHAEEAALLRSTLDELIGKALTGSVICSIIMQGDGSYAPYGLTELASRAAEHVKRSLSGADISFSSSAGAECDGAAASGIPAEHMWYLTTCVLTTAVKLSGHGRTVIDILPRDGRLCMRIVSPTSAFTARLPEHMTLSELKNVVPASSLRLFLCDLICDEYKASCDVHCGSDMLEITFEFKPRDTGRSFHRFDPVFPFAEWERIADAVVIPDTTVIHDTADAG